MSREFDLTSIWNRYVLDSLILTEPSIFESTLYAASWLPFPFPHIDVVVQARGIDLADLAAQCQHRSEAHISRHAEHVRHAAGSSFAGGKAAADLHIQDSISTAGYRLSTALLLCVQDQAASFWSNVSLPQGAAEG